MCQHDFRSKVRRRPILVLFILVFVILTVVFARRLINGLKISRINNELLLAIHNHDANLVRMLLDRGADPNVRDADMSLQGQLLNTFFGGKNSEINGRSALFVACDLDQSDVVKELLAYGANPNTKEIFDDPPLLYAAGNGKIDIVTLLVNAGANVNAPDGSGETPLNVAARGGSVAVAKILLTHAADINKGDDTGTTPLMIACINGDREMVELLIIHHANLNLRNRDGKSALQLVNASQYPAVSVIVRKAGAE